MALETLKDIKEIGGFKVAHFDENCVMNEQNPAKFVGTFIFIEHNENMLHLFLQNGPIKENGVNGVQVQTIIETAKLIIEGLNKNFPCRENSMIITKLHEAIMWSKKRTEDRIAREVEGLNKE
jgi:hypothetical protein